MQQISFLEKYDEPIVIGLGYFDCVHAGHRRLIENVKSAAKALNATPAIFTFINTLENFKYASVYNFDIRVGLFSKLGIELCVFAEMTPEFSTLSGEDFFKQLVTNFNVKCVICGEDYRFGKKASCGIAELKKFALAGDIEIKITPFELSSSGGKISSGTIYSFLKEGKLKEANALLGEPYFARGNVISNFKRGHKFGLPTANLKREVVILPDGVYATTCEIVGKAYDSVTNIGAKPTFEDDFKTAESHIIGFDGDLYGKEITVKFLDRLRDIKKFESSAELVNQIAQDITAAQNIQKLAT